LADFRIEPINAAQLEFVDKVIAAAFSRRTEAELVRRLRADRDVAVELVATAEGAPVGHVLFSCLAVDPPTIRIAALAPVSVKPEHQKNGIGSALIRQGLVECAEQGFDAVAVLGDPDYYRRFGFTADAARTLHSVYSGPAFQALELKPNALTGGPWRVTYPRAFADLQ